MIDIDTHESNYFIVNSTRMIDIDTHESNYFIDNFTRMIDIGTHESNYFITCQIKIHTLIKTLLSAPVSFVPAPSFSERHPAASAAFLHIFL